MLSTRRSGVRRHRRSSLTGSTAILAGTISIAHIARCVTIPRVLFGLCRLFLLLGRVIPVGPMAVPTQTSVRREAFSHAPIGEREGALALGSTRRGMIRTVVIPFGQDGIIGGIMLGLRRALGQNIPIDARTFDYANGRFG